MVFPGIDLSERSFFRAVLLQASVIIIVIVIIDIVNIFFLNRYLKSQAVEQFSLIVENQAFAVSQHIATYQRIVDRLAKRTDVHNLVFSEDRDAASLWASEHRAMMPDAVGLALTNSKGEVFGNPPELRVGPLCVADLKMIAHQHKILMPPFHNDNPDLVHFDISSKVLDEHGQVNGLVFASVSIDVLKPILFDFAEKNNIGVELVDGNNREILSIGKDVKFTEIIDFQIANTDWKILFRYQLPDTGETNKRIGYMLAITALIIIALIVYFNRHVIKKFTGQFEVIRKHLVNINQGNYQIPKSEDSYKETNSIVEEIQYLSSLLSKQHKVLLDLNEKDMLTGLANRQWLYKKMPDLFHDRRHNQFCLVLLDLDYFKQINDRYGHDFGDMVLKLFAKALRETSRDDDHLIRLGGDEFVVLFLDITKQGIIEWYKRLSQNFLDYQNNAEGLNLDVKSEISAGFVCSVDFQQVDSEREFLKMADKAMYQSKAKGKGCITDYLSIRPD